MSHLEDIGENYWAHGRAALRMAGRCLLAALYLLCHAVAPNRFVNNGGDVILQLANYITDRRWRTHKRKYR